MAGKTDPSIYDDRSTIGSSDELDEYGVWVKSEPQDLSSSLPEIEELPDIAGLDDDGSELPDFSDFSAPGPVPEGSDISSFSDSGADDFGLSDEDLNLSDDLALTEDLSLPDELSLTDELTAADEITLSDELSSLDELSSPSELSPLDEITLSDDLTSSDDIGLPEELGSSDELGLADSGNADDDDDDFPEDGFLGPLGGPDLEFQELPDDSALPQGSAPSKKSSGGYDDVSMDDFLESDSSDSTPKKIDFGNLDDVVEPERAAKSGGNADLSNQLLMKIADELSSIKKELASLKTELSVVRGEVKAEAADAKSGSFFDAEDDEKIALTGDELDNILHTAEEDDDDEKIALTGDELDNILHTADFIEEAGSDEGLNDDLSFGEDTVEIESLSGETGFLSDQEDLIGKEAVISELSEDADSEETIDISFEDAAFPDFGEESSELSELRESGIKPMTPPPEDTSYLEADPLASAPIEEETLDLSGAVIDEPDLSSQIVENPVTEPALDNISIDVDMEEPLLPESSASDDFVFEVEDTMELPISQDEPAMEPLDFTTPEESGGLDIPFDAAPGDDEIPSNLKVELKTVLSYMDQLLEALPEDKIEEFARSDYFETYKKLFEELGLA